MENSKEPFQNLLNTCTAVTEQSYSIIFQLFPHIPEERSRKSSCICINLHPKTCRFQFSFASLKRASPHTTITMLRLMQNFCPLDFCHCFAAVIGALGVKIVFPRGWVGSKTEHNLIKFSTHCCHLSGLGGAMHVPSRSCPWFRIVFSGLFFFSLAFVFLEEMSVAVSEAV